MNERSSNGNNLESFSISQKILEKSFIQGYLTPYASGQTFRLTSCQDGNRQSAIRLPLSPSQSVTRTTHSRFSKALAERLLKSDAAADCRSSRLPNESESSQKPLAELKRASSRPRLSGCASSRRSTAARCRGCLAAHPIPCPISRSVSQWNCTPCRQPISGMSPSRRSLPRDTYRHCAETEAEGFGGGGEAQRLPSRLSHGMSSSRMISGVNGPTCL